MEQTVGTNNQFTRQAINYKFYYRLGRKLLFWYCKFNKDNNHTQDRIAIRFMNKSHFDFTENY